MAFTWQELKYGWVALASLVVTGTTIYVASNTRVHVYPVDVIEIALATTEKCLATQYSTNPVQYRVTPPTFTRTWLNTNGVAETVTNAIGNYTDIDMMRSLDDTIKAVVTNYGWSNSPGENMTFTGLLANLNIGNGTDFTSVPCWTNDAQWIFKINFTNYYPNTGSPDIVAVTSLYPETVRYAYDFWSNGFYWTNRLFDTSNSITTTNIATYGTYAQQVYVTALQERYKVLNAMEYMIDQNRDVVDKSFWGGGKWTIEVYKYPYSNKVTGVYPEYGHTPNVQAYLSGLTEDYYYRTYPYSTNFYPYYGGGTPYTNIPSHWNPTYSEAQINSEWDWYYSVLYDPPYRTYTTNHDSTWDTTYLNYVGEACQSRKGIYHYIVSDPSYPFHEYLIRLSRAYGTIRWANYQYTNIPSTFSVYYKGATNYPYFGNYDTEIATNDSWSLPREWTIDQTWTFEEDVTPNDAYQKLSDAYISQSNQYSQVVFGADQFPKLVYSGSMPPWSAEPSGGVSWSNNAGSVWTVKGLALYHNNIKGVRKYQFNYATNKFW